MRREEFEITDENEIISFLNEQNTGILSLVDMDDFPYTLPVNYQYYNDRIYIHGSKKGKKIKLLNDKRLISFTVYKEYSFIPSYYTGSKMPCNASMFFKCVLIKGRASIINDDDEKIEILNILMEKIQPEKNYNEMNAADEIFKRVLNNTAIISIEPVVVTAKFKFGQHLPDDKIDLIVNNLKKRNNPLDMKTIEMINRYRNQ